MADSIEYTDPDLVLTNDQRRRMRDIARTIPEDVELFVRTMGDEARKQAAMAGEAFSSKEWRAQLAMQKRIAAEITTHLQQAFSKLPHTTNALTEQLRDSQRQLAAKAFEKDNTTEDTAFYVGVSKLYNELCQVTEQQILFTPENLPTPPSRGWSH